MTDLRSLVLSTLLAATDGPDLPAWLAELLDEGLAGITAFTSNLVVHEPGSPNSFVGTPGSPVADSVWGVDPPVGSPLIAAIRVRRPDAIVAIDEEGGDVSRLAAARGGTGGDLGHAVLGAIDDPAVTETTAARIGARLAALGVSLDFAPCADVNTVDANPVIGTRSFGSDPHEVARHTLAFVRGLQSAGVSACPKHFPGHGASRVDSHAELPRIEASLATMMARDLPPYSQALGEARAVMLGHLKVDAFGPAPTSQNPNVVDLLRGGFGFEGCIVTDALDMGAVAGASRHPAPAALAAGCDLLCLGSELDREGVERVVAAVEAAVEQGVLSIDRLIDAGRRCGELGTPTPQPDGGTLRLPSDRPAARTDLTGTVSTSGALTESGQGPITVVECHPAESPASADLIWGLAGAIEAEMPASVHRVDESDHTRVVEGIDLVGPTSVVIVRNRAAHPWQDSVIAELARRHVDTVVVELGWPSGDHPHASCTIDAFGAAEANREAALAALVDVLGAGPASEHAVELNAHVQQNVDAERNRASG